jgi:hypothetical protein
MKAKANEQTSIPTRNVLASVHLMSRESAVFSQFQTSKGAVGFPGGFPCFSRCAELRQWL